MLGDSYLALLRAIDEEPSLRDAAERCGLSYRTAWSRVAELNRLADAPLVLSVNGGPGGGTSVLSEEGKRLLGVQSAASRAFSRALESSGVDSDDLGSLWRFLRRLSMRTSVRNQWPVELAGVRSGRVESEVHLRMANGVAIVSRITTRGLESLRLGEASEIFALVKATHVGLLPAGERSLPGGGNMVPGTVVAVHKGDRRHEVEVDLGRGATLVASLGCSAYARSGIEPGKPVWGTFDASSVILGAVG